jgi:TRAP-type C4-dicarboxylate transport system permease small subunit
MALIVIINVFGRFLLGMPLKGVVELVEVIMPVIAFFSIVHTQQERVNVHVDLVLGRLRGRIKSIMTSFGFFLGLVTYGIITYQASIEALWYARDLGQRTALFHIPFAPFRFIMVLGCFLLCLRLLVDMFRPLSPEKWTEGDLT